jgi:multiple sugar transport system permease protein
MTEILLQPMPDGAASERLRPRPAHRRWWQPRAEERWALAFLAPYAGVLVAFVVYPFGYALWLGGRPSLFAELFDDPAYLQSLVNTLSFVGLGVNLQMFLALLLSGFFLRRGWWVRAVLAVFLLPWLIAAAQACVSFHWMLIDERGLVDRLLTVAFGIDGPRWFSSRGLALGVDIAAYMWKWLPFWTVIFLAGRLMIARDIYDAAAVDGVTGWRRFLHVTFPLLANLYLVCTLLSALWALGDFTTVYLVSAGGPALSTEVLATLGFRYAFDIGRPELGVAAVLSALPVLIPIVIVLMRRVQMSEVQL